jgi:hypothetical protein
MNKEISGLQKSYVSGFRWYPKLRKQHNFALPYFKATSFGLLHGLMYF